MTVRMYGKARVSKVRGGSYWISASGLTEPADTMWFGYGVKRTTGAPTILGDCAIGRGAQSLPNGNAGAYKWKPANDDYWARVEALVHPETSAGYLEGDYLWLFLFTGIVDDLVDGAEPDLWLAAGRVLA